MSEAIDFWIRQGVTTRVCFVLEDGKISHFMMLSVPKSKVLKVAPFEYRPESLLEDLMALKNDATSRGK
jgi:hypothetical protein